jgi:2'-5' RNA ligase
VTLGNWFVGLPVSPGPWWARLPPVPAGFRRFHPDDLHLTVAFLGPVGEDRARAAFDALAWPLAAVDVTFGEVVAMGDPRRYSALSALLARGRDEVERAMGTARGPVADAAGIARERRAPKAHVTLARPRRDAAAAQRAQGLAWARALDLSDAGARLDRVALYGWSEDRRERLFRVVCERSLR